MSETIPSPSRPLQVLAYSIVALAIAFELTVVWLMLHPQVPDDYRAYYIDHTTTCLNQPVSGDYVLGETVSFRSDGRNEARPLRVCGWEGPAGDGTHSVGRSSRLRFAVPAPAAERLTLRLELVAVERDGHPSQRIGVAAGGIALGAVTAIAGAPATFEVDVPAQAITAGTLELELHFADAIRMSPTDSDTRLRAIKLLSARLGPAQ